MADEITVAVSLKVVNGNYKESTPNYRFFDTQAAIGAHAAVVSVGTAEEVMPEGDVASEGWLVITNTDTTNYVDYGPESGGAMVALGRLEAGETHLLKLKPGIVVRWQANTATVKVKMLLLDR